MDAGLLLFSLIATFFAAALTVPAGFGLATMITPVVFFGLVLMAVAVVAIVHGFITHGNSRFSERASITHRSKIWMGNGHWRPHWSSTEYNR